MIEFGQRYLHQAKCKMGHRRVKRLGERKTDDLLPCVFAVLARFYTRSSQIFRC